MTVKELTGFLLREDPDMDVLVDGYEDGFDPIGQIHRKSIKECSDPQWYYGKYEEGSGNSSKIALVLSRH